jgi:hypothetical protein
MSDMTFRDFDAAIAEERGAGLSTFKLGGQTFTIIPLPFEALATFAVLQGQAVADPAALVKIVEFLAECVLEDADKVRAAVKAARPSMRVMLDLCGWAIELSTGRPTVPPSDSLLEVRPATPSSTPTFEPPAPVPSPG